MPGSGGAPGGSALSDVRQLCPEQEVKDRAEAAGTGSQRGPDTKPLLLPAPCPADDALQEDPEPWSTAPAPPKPHPPIPCPRITREGRATGMKIQTAPSFVLCNGFHRRQITVGNVPPELLALARGSSGGQTRHPLLRLCRGRERARRRREARELCLPDCDPAVGTHGEDSACSGPGMRLRCTRSEERAPIASAAERRVGAHGGGPCRWRGRGRGRG